MADNNEIVRLLPLLIPRLTQQKQTELMLLMLENKKTDFQFIDCLNYTKVPIEDLSWDMLRKTSAWNRLLKEIANVLEKEAYLDNYYISQELAALGLLLPQTVAERALKTLIDTGLLLADPLLNYLKLNIQLSLPKG